MWKGTHDLGTGNDTKKAKRSEKSAECQMGPEYEKDEASQQVRRQIEPRQRSPRRR